MDRAAKYRTIVADPPWDYADAPLGHQRAVGMDKFLAYPTLTVDEIAAVPVPIMAVPGAHVYLWTTPRFLWDARRILDCWGVSAATIGTWCKSPMGSGGGSAAFANTTEFFLWGRRSFADAIRDGLNAQEMTTGDLERATGRVHGMAQRWLEGTFPNPRDAAVMADLFGWSWAGAPTKRHDTTWFSWPRQSRHSQKPDAFGDLVEETSPGPYLELFARRQRLGWDTWGDQALEHVEMA